MKQMLLSGRILIGFAVVLGTLLIGSPAPASAQNDVEPQYHGARITIHNTVCPSDVEDIFDQCHDHRLSGSPFYVAGVWRTANGDGVVSWEPGAGPHEVVQNANVFAGYNGAYVFCSNQVTGEVVLDGPIYDQPVITITTTAGQEVICDWYNLLPPGDPITLTAYLTACPPGYEGDDYYADCYENPQAGVRYSAYDPRLNAGATATTGDNGVVTFELPNEFVGDPINLQEGAGESEPPPFAAFCTKNGGQPVDFQILDQFHQIQIEDSVSGDQIHCDWFSLP